MSVVKVVKASITEEPLMLCSRRYVLGSTSYLLGAGLAAPFLLKFSCLQNSLSNTACSVPPQGDPQVIVFQDHALFDQSGMLPVYQPPTDPGAATRSYVRSVDEQTFISRHWFV